MILGGNWEDLHPIEIATSYYQLGIIAAKKQNFGLISRDG